MLLKRFIFFCIIFMLWGTEAFCVEINISPLFYFNSSEDEIYAVGPLLERNSEYTALRPIFCKESDHIDILYPLGKKTDTSLRLTPFLKYETGEEEEQFNLFPFFYGKEKEESYGGVFPLYGTLKERFGFDTASFVLWPFYTKTIQEETATYSFVWPIVTYSKDTKFKIFPLYGWEKNKDNASEYFYVLWPIFHHKTSPDAEMNAMLPLFFYEKGRYHKSISSPWPFFTYNKDIAAPHKSIDCPWPLIRFATGAYEESRVFPLYWKKESPNYEMKSILWPLYKKEYSANTFLGGSTEKTQILVLSGITRDMTSEKKEVKTVNIWPLYRSLKNDAILSWHIPNIIPYSDEGFSHNIQPILTLANHKRDGACSDLDVLWNTFSYTRTASSKKSALSFLFSYEKKDGQTRIGFLHGLLRFTRHRSNVDN